jgi:hypothetical protein
MGSAAARRQLVAPALPVDGAWLWAAFLELDRWRGMGMMGPAPLTLHDLAAYEARYGVTLTPDEADAIKALDAERLAAAAPEKGTP